jgi:hypothetical protein
MPRLTSALGNGGTTHPARIASAIRTTCPPGYVQVCSKLNVPCTEGISWAVGAAPNGGSVSERLSPNTETRFQILRALSQHPEMTQRRRARHQPGQGQLLPARPGRQGPHQGRQLPAQPAQGPLLLPADAQRHQRKGRPDQALPRTHDRRTPGPNRRNRPPPRRNHRLGVERRTSAGCHLTTPVVCRTIRIEKEPPQQGDRARHQVRRVTGMAHRAEQRWPLLGPNVLPLQRP